MSERSPLSQHEKEIQVNLSILAAPALVWLALAAIVALSPAPAATPEVVAQPPEVEAPLGA